MRLKFKTARLQITLSFQYSGMVDWEYIPVLSYAWHCPLSCSYTRCFFFSISTNFSSSVFVHANPTHKHLDCLHKGWNQESTTINYQEVHYNQYTYDSQFHVSIYRELRNLVTLFFFNVYVFGYVRFSCNMWDLVPDQDGTCLKHTGSVGVLATGSPGKVPKHYFWVHLWGCLRKITCIQSDGSKADCLSHCGWYYLIHIEGLLLLLLSCFSQCVRPCATLHRCRQPTR